MPRLTALDSQDGNALLTMARLGWLLTRQLGTLCYPTLQPRAVRWRLDRLKDRGMIAGFHASTEPTPREGRRKIPIKQGQVWRLLPPAVPHLAELYPELDLEARKPCVAAGPICSIEHQIEIIDLLIHLLHGIEQVPGLLGIDVERDKWLYNVGHRRLRIDTYLLVRRRVDGSHAVYRPGYGVPWLRYPLGHGEVERALWVEIPKGEYNYEAGARDTFCRFLIEKPWKGKFVPPFPLYVRPAGVSLAYLQMVWEPQPKAPWSSASLADLTTYGAMAPIWYRRQWGGAELERRPLFSRFAETLYEEE